MGERAVIIRNPISGGGKESFVNQVAERLRRGGQDVRVVPTEAAGHAAELVDDIITTKSADVIIAAGGDGTIRDVVEGTFGRGMPVGIIPAGTANVLARELGYMPHGRISATHISDVILSRSLRDVYPFDVQFAGASRMGVCWLGAGFDARVLKHVSPWLKAKVGRPSFVPATFKALWQDGREPLIRWSEEGSGAGEAAWIVAANIQRYAGPFVLTRQTAANKAGLACLMMPRAGAWPRMVDQITLAIGHMDRRANCRMLGNGSLSLGDDSTPIQLDGDFIGHGRATITPRLVPIPFRAYV